jgi:tight adherence protein B
VSRRLVVKIFALALAVFAAPQALAAGTLEITPVGRVPFPDRSYVLDLPQDAAVEAGAVRVTENGSAVGNLRVSPLAASGLKFGVVLALDASESMYGKPFRSAVAAASTFVARGAPSQEIGLVAFNRQLHVLQEPTLDRAAVALTLGRPPALRYGTRIYDALDQGLASLARAKVSAGSIVLLSDGTDVGSNETLASVLRKALGQHVRIFTVGLRSRAFDARPLRLLATKTGGSYAEASSATELEPIYRALSQRLASEYLVGYRSAARPRSHVHVTVAVKGLGTAGLAYTAPTPSGLAPYHRSFVSRFLLSATSLVVLSLLVATFVAFAVQALLGRRRTAVVRRVNEFVPGEKPAAPVKKRKGVRAALARSPAAGGKLARFERDLEIAGIGMSAQGIVVLTGAATTLVGLALALVSPVLALLALLVPLGPHAIVKRRLARVRNEFDDQLPTNLAVLASALRAGHGFSGALSVVVDNAHEPSQRELRRALTDDQLGVPPEDALRRVAVRMASRDVEQVALVAELQRTAGGNAAEVLDTVVETIRERGDLRRLVRTLTAQGRMARWILTALPVVVASLLWLIQPELMRPLVATSGGQVALVVAALMVTAGSLLIQKIVDIKV